MKKINTDTKVFRNYVLPFGIKKVTNYWNAFFIITNIKRVERGLMSDLPPTLVVITPDFTNRMKLSLHFEKILKCNSLEFLL